MAGLEALVLRTRQLRAGGHRPRASRTFLESDDRRAILAGRPLLNVRHYDP